MDAYKDFPKSIIVEPTVSCNQICPFCPRWKIEKNTGFMEWELYTKLLDEIAQYPDRRLSLFRRGESLLHKRIVDMFEYARPRVSEIQLMTNGTCLTPKISEALCDKLDFISFSLDVKSKFAERRGGNYDKTVEKILYFLGITDNKKVETQVSIVETDDMTQEEVEEFKNFWVDKVNRVRIYQEHSKDGKFGSIQENDRGERKTCMKPSYETLVYFDGTVGRCNHDWNGKILGDVNQQTIAEVWQNTAYQDLREQHETLNITDETCNACDSWYPTLTEQGTGKIIAKS